MSVDFLGAIITGNTRLFGYNHDSRAFTPILMMVLRTVINQLAVRCRNQNREADEINGLIKHVSRSRQKKKKNDNG